MKRRLAWRLLLLAAAMAAAADVAYWRFATTRLQDGIAQWQESIRQKGWAVGSTTKAGSGWPFVARVTVANLTLRHLSGEDFAQVEFAAPAVTVSLPLLHPGEPHVTVANPMHLRVGRMPDLILTADRLDGWARKRHDGMLAVSVRGRGLRVEAASGLWHATAADLEADAEIPAAGKAAPTAPLAQLSVRAGPIGLPSSVHWPLGQDIGAMSLQVRMSGPWPAAAGLTRAAAAWRDGGGSCEVTKLALAWGPLNVAASATLALDDALQPTGTGIAHVAGYAATLERLAAGGVMSRSAATAATAVLSLLAGVGDGDAPASVDVPLTLQSRTLSMHQVPLLRIPALDWPPPG